MLVRDSFPRSTCDLICKQMNMNFKILKNGFYAEECLLAYLLAVFSKYEWSERYGWISKVVFSRILVA